MKQAKQVKKPKPVDDPILNVTIDRAKWRRTLFGKRLEDNALLNLDGSMCCLGFVSKACGYTKDELEEIATPVEVHGDPKPKYDSVFKKLCKKQNSFVTLNDNKLQLPEHEREKLLTEAFAKIGIAVKFSGKTPKLTKIASWFAGWAYD